MGDTTPEAITLPGDASDGTPLYGIGPYAGMVEPGNIDLGARPRVKNPDGSVSTVRSMSFGSDKGEVLVPTVSDDGRILSDEEAIQSYRQTGRHLGVFDTPGNATAYASALHDQQERMYGPVPGADPADSLAADYQGARDRTIGQGPAARLLSQGEPTPVPGTAPPTGAEPPAPAEPGTSPSARPPLQTRAQVMEYGRAMAERIGQGDPLKRQADFVDTLYNLTVKPAKDIVVGTLEAPGAALRGVATGIANMAQLVGDVADWMYENVPDAIKGGPFDAIGKLREETGNPDLMPSDFAVLSKAGKRVADLVPPPTTVTGNVVQFTSQWLVGKKIAGGISKSFGVPQTWWNSVITDMAAGATVMDPKASRLSNLIEEVAPNPITEFLQAKPDDSAAEGRLKNALEIGGIGLAVDGVVKGLKLLKAGMAKQGVEIPAAPASAIDGADDAIKAAVDKMDDAARSQYDDLGRQINTVESTYDGPLPEAARSQVESLRAARDRILKDAGYVPPAGGGTAVAEAAKRDYLAIGDTAKPLIEIKTVVPEGVVTRDVAAEAARAVGERQAKIAELMNARQAAQAARQPTKTITAQIAKLKGEITAIGEKSTAVVKAAAQAREIAARIDPARFAQQADDFLKGTVPDNPVTVNVGRIDGPDALKQAVADISKMLPENRPISHLETMQAAKELGMTPEQLILQQQRGAMSSSQITAARLVNTSVIQQAVDLAEAARKSGAPLDLAKAQKAIALAMETTKTLRNETTEIARALSAHRIMASSEPDMVKAARQLIDNNGGADAAMDLMDKLAGLKDPAKVSELLNEVAKGATRDKLSFIYMNLLVSNPTSHVANVTGNTMSSAIGLWERWLAGKIRSAVGGQGTVEGEAMAEMFGRLQSTKDAFVLAGRSLRTGEQLFGATKDMPTSVLGQAPLSNIGPAAASDYLKMLLPARWLGAEDAVFKWTAYRGDLAAQAYRMATREGLAGDIMAKRIAELMRYPSDAMRESAVAYAMKSTFNAPVGPVISSIAQGMRNWTYEVRPGVEIPIGKTLALPFVTTPTNIFKWSYHRAGPLALISREVRADLAAGGARADMAMARMATGTALMGISLDLALSGTLTGGGPRDPATRKRLVDGLGWQADSLRLGNKYVSVSRFDTPFQLMSIIPNTLDIMAWAKDEDRENMAAAIGLAFAKAVVSKTYMQGVSRLVDAISYPERYGENWTESAVTSLMPAGIRGIARSMDPSIRAVYDVADAIRANTPGLSQTLPPRRDFWGRPVMRGGAWLFGLDPLYGEIVSPLRLSTVKDSAIDREMLRLGIKMMPVKEHAAFNGVPMELTPQEVDRYSALQGQEIRDPLTGKNAYDTLNDMVQGLGPRGAAYMRLADTARATMIQSYVQAFREAARAELMKESRPLSDAVIQGLRDKTASRMPGAVPSVGAAARERTIEQLLPAQ